MTAATFLQQHIFFYHYLKKLHESFYQYFQFYHFFKMALSNFYTRIFSTLEHLSFFQNKFLIIQRFVHTTILKPFLVHVVKLMKRTKKFHSNCRYASQVSYVAVRQWLEILINGFFIKNLGKYWHNVLLNS